MSSEDSPRPIAVVDIDGVLADVAHRLKHLQQRPKDWDAFFDAAESDPAFDEGLHLAKQLSENHDIVYLSGRPERCRESTQTWLQDQGAPPGELLLRNDYDRRPARVMKVEVARALAQRAMVAIVIDDDEAVLASMEEAGFTTLHAQWSVNSPTLFSAQEIEGRS